MGAWPLTFRFEFWFKPIELSYGKDIENDGKTSPENPAPKGREELREGRRHRSIPIEKS